MGKLYKYDPTDGKRNSDPPNQTFLRTPSRMRLGAVPTPAHPALIAGETTLISSKLYFPTGLTILENDEVTAALGGRVGGRGGICREGGER